MSDGETLKTAFQEKKQFIGVAGLVLLLLMIIGALVLTHQLVQWLGFTMAGLVIAGGVWWFLKNKPDNFRSTSKVTAEMFSKDPSTMPPGKSVWLRGDASIGFDTFRVTAREMHDSGDEVWYELELEDLINDCTRYLCAVQDDDDCWYWMIGERLSNKEVADIRPLQGFAFNTDHDMPRKLTVRGAVWGVEDEENDWDYNVHVVDERVGREESARWEARTTDYTETGGSRGLCVELYEGGKMGVTINRRFTGTVEFDL